MRISDWSSDVCSSDLAGEVLGLAGTLGSGRSELLHAIFGADPAATGPVLLDGTPVGRWPDEAVAAGIALVPEDQIERASGRERVCQSVWISVVAVYLKKKIKT